MKILITGAGGYLGSVLSNYFSKKGIEVIGIDIHKDPSLPNGKKFRFYRCGVQERKRLERIFSKEKPTHVIHLAYSMNKLRDAKEEHEIDVEGSKNVLEISNNTGSVKQFILFSSASAYGARPDNPLWIKENRPLAPKGYNYAINKKKIEGYCNNFKKRDGLKVIILRVCIVVGPHYKKKKGAVRVLAKSPFLIRKSRNCKLQFIHENDMNRLMELIVKDDTIEGTFNMAPHDYSTIGELTPKKRFLPIPMWISKLVIGTLWSLRIINFNTSALDYCVYDIIVDPSKLVARYKYEFQYTTMEGFVDTVSKWE